MAEHNTLGHEGEEAAALYLILHGYNIRHVDWRLGHRDLDIVAEKPGLIVFVEVKTRRNEDFGNAEEAVDKEKELNIIDAADAYMRYFRLDCPVRFDIMAVVGLAPPFEIRHIENAFEARW